MSVTQFAPAAFQLDAPFQPTGDQPQAIQALVEHLRQEGERATLLGVTGSGKTFSMANVIAQLQRPTLILSHNKTLAAQLYSEFKGFFPNNAVEYFVSYYDYYQPEAYVASRDLYIEKESSINEEIDKLRLSATRSLLSRRDVIIIASVSAIYGLGSPKAYQDLTLELAIGDIIQRDELLRDLVAVQYNRSDLDLKRGTFRVRGERIEIWPAYDDSIIRLSFFDQDLEQIEICHALTGEVLGRTDGISIYPAKHFVVDEPTLEESLGQIKTDLASRYTELLNQNHLVEAQRLQARTTYDLEMLEEAGYCPGIENYSRYLSGRKAGERPYCLYDFFPPDFLTIIDESHVTVPQVGGMYAGDKARKDSLVDHGFRLPSALDNRPMRFDEWESMLGKRVFVSATPGPYEAAHEEIRTEQLIRPTGLLDPQVEVRPTDGQIENLEAAIRERTARGERTLVTTVTKRLAEDIAEYLGDQGISVTWLHSELDALERIDIMQQLRNGDVDVLVGVNLLREGLDFPEVSLVAILDADKEGFLRSTTSLIQIMGRAARHVHGTVLCYADRISPGLQKALDETSRRREAQQAYNTKHGITPRSAHRRDTAEAFKEQLAGRRQAAEVGPQYDATDLSELKALLLAAAEDLRFEEAARLRDQMQRLEAGEAASSAKTGGFKAPQRAKRTGKRGAGKRSSKKK
jgi:excinuclease ABC subunit B